MSDDDDEEEEDRTTMWRSVFRPNLFRGKVALVTGGGSGIGRSVASELAHLGAIVVIASRDGEKCTVAAREMNDEISLREERRRRHRTRSIEEEEDGDGDGGASNRDATPPSSKILSRVMMSLSKKFCPDAVVSRGKQSALTRT